MDIVIPFTIGGVEPPRYVTALALPATREKELVDLQRAALSRWSLPSALAFPPVMPLAVSRRPPEDGFFRGLRRAPWKTAAVRGCERFGPLLLAAADFGSLPPAAAPSGAPDLRPFAPEEAWDPAPFPPAPLPGFYIADLGSAEADIGEIPPPPGGLIRALRLLVLEVFFAPAPGPWWRAVRWETQREEWIKLRP